MARRKSSKQGRWSAPTNDATNLLKPSNMKLRVRQLDHLDRISRSILLRSGARIGRSSIVRAIVEALHRTNASLADATSEQHLADILTSWLSPDNTPPPIDSNVRRTRKPKAPTQLYVAGSNDSSQVSWAYVVVRNNARTLKRRGFVPADFGRGTINPLAGQLYATLQGMEACLGQQLNPVEVNCVSPEVSRLATGDDLGGTDWTQLYCRRVEAILDDIRWHQPPTTHPEYQYALRGAQKALKKRGS